MFVDLSLTKRETKARPAHQYGQAFYRLSKLLHELNARSPSANHTHIFSCEIEIFRPETRVVNYAFVLVKAREVSTVSLMEQASTQEQILAPGIVSGFRQYRPPAIFLRPLRRRDSGMKGNVLSQVEHIHGVCKVRSDLDVIWEPLGEVPFAPNFWKA